METKPRRLNDVAREAYGQSLAQRFEWRLAQQAREGHFGALRSRNAQMRSTFEKLAALLPHRNTPFFIFGEHGTGKQRLVHEFHSLQTFLDRLEERPTGVLKVLRGDYLQPGFSRAWNTAFKSGDLVYIDSVEKMSIEAQRELLPCLISQSLACRVVVSSKVALSLRVTQGSFLRELFAAITQCAVYLPSLIDRGEDLTQLMSEILYALGSVKTLPKAGLVNMIARADLPRNLEDLETLMRAMLAKKYQPDTWTLEDFPPSFRTLFPQPGDLVNRHHEKAAVQRALLESGGDTSQAALMLGLDRASFLQKMLTLRVR